MAEQQPDHTGIARVEGNLFRNRGFSTEKQGYETSNGFFGGTIKQDGQGKAVFDMRPGFYKAIDTFDRFGDPRVRSIDEHAANAGLFLRHAGRVWKNRAVGLAETLKLKTKSEAQKKTDATWQENKHKWASKEKGQNVAPRSLLKLAAEGFGKGYSLRYRGNPDEITENIDRLGLTEYYGRHPWGIEIKKPETYTDGVSLYDIVVAKKEGKTPLEEIDHSQALAEAAKYIRQVHDQHGPIGELLVMDIQFQSCEGNKALNPVLGIPDIVWNTEATSSETAKKATDIMDFLVNVDFWERKAGTDPEVIQQELDTILENYGDESVIRAIRSFVNPDRKSKKPTLPGESKLATLHNNVRLGSEKQWTSDVRQDVFDATVKFLHPQAA